ncbi:hypothetical protein [Vibrio crassostreae]|uniref:hypothetical protein n=1 Tax=Vibrio crassostreae TaxID=246167 RepID=UPI001B313BE0|nr:hypothetical protein [Vibrio crassostreae]
MMKNQTAQHAFNKLVNRDFKLASHEDVKSVALAVWHENFVPDVSNLDLQSARAANYVLDRLMRYHCVNRDEQFALDSLVNKLSDKFGLKPLTNLPKDRKVDRSARQWGLTSDLRVLFREMAPYQTRHYQHH